MNFKKKSWYILYFIYIIIQHDWRYTKKKLTYFNIYYKKDLCDLVFEINEESGVLNYENRNKTFSL